MKSTVAILLMTLIVCANLPADDSPAAWEVKALGINDEAKLKELRDLPIMRRVTLAVVGQSGVSLKMVEQNLSKDHTLAYAEGATDVGTNTHDTQAINVMIPLAAKLSVPIDFHVYQPGSDFSEVAESFRKAAESADIVVLYQSFWGKGVDEMAKAILAGKGALFVSPYVESGGRPTSTCLQAHSLGEAPGRLRNFITCVPLARKDPSTLLSPSRRNENDTEVINFICPSYYASSAGGTCPSATVCCVAAAYVISRAKEKPLPEKIVDILKNAATTELEYLQELPEFDEESLLKLKEQTDALYAKKMLYSPGILNVYKIYHILKTR